MASAQGIAGGRRTPRSMETNVREMPELELALLRRSLDRIAAGREHCDRCHRTPLVGERVYSYASGATLCELCKTLERAEPCSWQTVHGPEFGHTLRIVDRRSQAA